jgi:hypothetical protein
VVDALHFKARMQIVRSFHAGASSAGRTVPFSTRRRTQAKAAPCGLNTPGNVSPRRSRMTATICRPPVWFWAKRRSTQSSARLPARPWPPNYAPSTSASGRSSPIWLPFISTVIASHSLWHKRRLVGQPQGTWPAWICLLPRCSTRRSPRVSRARAVCGRQTASRT